MEINYKDIGRRISKERHNKNLRQEELAERSNLSTVHLAHIEGGTTKLGLSALINIANALGVSADALLSGVCYKCKEILMDELAEIINECTPEQINLIIQIAKVISQNKMS
ncbi:MAG: helix-turn-helix transcriptional regulator [Clostridia bacterium]|nr:helix-turn-helix transcriptional regulator [Clostridia bacterium]